MHLPKTEEVDDGCLYYAPSDFMINLIDNRGNHAITKILVLTPCRFDVALYL
jgi:hypothetical protein